MIIGFRYDIFFDDVNPEVLFFSNKVVSIYIYPKLEIKNEVRKKRISYAIQSLTTKMRKIFWFYGTFDGETNQVKSTHYDLSLVDAIAVPAMKTTL